MYVINRYVKAVNDAEEILQDTFISIFRNIKQFDSNKGSFNTWTHRIAINQSLMFIRKKRKVTIVESDLSQLQNHISNSGLENLHLEDLLKEIDKLDEKYRTILTLRLIEGYDYAEISSLISIQEATIRKIFSRARKKLIDILKVNAVITLNPISEKINL